MKRNCNLCGKKSILWTRHLIHGNNRFQLCRHCASRIHLLGNGEHYEAAKAYIESKMQLGQNERMNYILKSRIQNTFQWTGKETKDEPEEDREESTIAALVQSIGILGGGVLFLLGICMLNIHLKLAVALILSALLLGSVLYGTGILISLAFRHIERK